MVRAGFVVLSAFCFATVAQAQQTGAQPSTAPTNGGKHHPQDTGGGSPNTGKPVVDAGKAAATPPAEAPPAAAPPAAAPPPAAPPPAAPPVTCNDSLTDAEIQPGLDKVSKLAGKDPNDYYLISIGPDGLPISPPPTRMAEDKPLVVVLYRPLIIPGGGKYSVTVTGCQPTPVRVSGSLADAKKAFAGAARPQLTSDVQVIGRCSSDSSVTITVTVPTQVTYCPSPAPTPIVLKTDPVYLFTVALGALASFGSFKQVGVDPGVGGAPGMVFERTQNTQYNFAGVVMFYPLGLDPNEPFGWRRLCIGTSVPLTDPISTANILVGLALVPGLQVAIGMQLLHKDQVLDSGLKNGSIYNDDSSTLPTHDEWRVDPAFVVSVSLGTGLLSDIKGH